MSLPSSPTNQTQTTNLRPLPPIPDKKNITNTTTTNTTTTTSTTSSTAVSPTTTTTTVFATEPRMTSKVAIPLLTLTPSPFPSPHSSHTTARSPRNTPVSPRAIPQSPSSLLSKKSQHSLQATTSEKNPSAEKQGQDLSPHSATTTTTTVLTTTTSTTTSTQHSPSPLTQDLLPSNEPVLQVRRLTVAMGKRSHDAGVPATSRLISVSPRDRSNSSMNAQPVKNYGMAQMTSALASLMVNQVTAKILPPNRIGEIGRGNISMSKDSLPAELAALHTNTPARQDMISASSLLQNCFFPMIKNTNIWPAVKGGENMVLVHANSQKSIEHYSDEQVKQLRSMIKPFAQDMAEFLLGATGKIADSTLPKELINFLLDADQQFLARYLEVSDLSVKDINHARLQFLKNVLITRILGPLIISEGAHSSAALTNLFRTEKFAALLLAFNKWAPDFFIKSYECMPKSLKTKLENRVQQELQAEKSKKATVLVKERISSLKTKKSSRTLMPANEGEISPRVNFLQEKAKEKELVKNNRKLIDQILKDFSIDELAVAFQSSVGNDKKIWAKSGKVLTEEDIMDKLDELAQLFQESQINLGKSTDARIQMLSDTLKTRLGKDLAEQTKNRATTVVLSDAFFADLENMLVHTLAIDESNVDASITTPSTADV